MNNRPDDRKSSTMRINRDNIYFVMVEPRTPGNIGAAARAVKTMGFRNLVLVNPGDYFTPEARWMAHASEDVLEQAQIYGTMEEAVSEMNFVVATTQRSRSFHLPYYTASELAQKAVPISTENKIAIVFGREKTGLTNEELGYCDAVSTIPAHLKHPSLNLSQSVMLYSYEFYQAAYGEEKKYHWKIASHGQLENLYKHMRDSLMRVDFVPIDSWDNFIMRFSRFFGRSQPEVRDVNVWHKILDAFDNRIRQLESELSALDEEKQ